MNATLVNAREDIIVIMLKNIWPEVPHGAELVQCHHLYLLLA